jgi:hypothetical protein
MAYVCSFSHGGCGFVGHEQEFRKSRNEETGDEVVTCPQCEADAALYLRSGLMKDVREKDKKLGYWLLDSGSEASREEVQNYRAHLHSEYPVF